MPTLTALATAYRRRAERSHRADDITAAHILQAISRMTAGKAEAALAALEHSAVEWLALDGEVWGTGADRARRPGARPIAAEALLSLVKLALKRVRTLPRAKLDQLRLSPTQRAARKDPPLTLATALRKAACEIFPQLPGVALNPAIRRTWGGLLGFLRHHVAEGHSLASLDPRQLAERTLIDVGMEPAKASNVYGYVRQAQHRKAKKLRRARQTGA